MPPSRVDNGPPVGIKCEDAFKFVLSQNEDDMSRSLSLRAGLLTAALAIVSFVAPTPRAEAQVLTRDAEALAHFCGANYSTPVRIDGRQDDWENGAGTTFRVEQLIAGEYRLDWTGPNDASFLLWCRQADDALYFAVVGRDNFINAPHDEGKGDRIELWFGLPNPSNANSPRVLMTEIPLWPMLENGRSTVRFGYGGDGNVPGAEAFVASRKEGKGFFVEAKIPMQALGTTVGFEPIRFAAVQRDWDHDGGVEQEVGVGSSVVVAGNAESLGHLRFGRFVNRLTELLDQRGISHDQTPAAQTWANVTGDARREWIGVLGQDVVVTGEGIPGWQTTQIRVSDHETHEPVEIQALNLDPDPDLELVYRYRITRMDSSSRVFVQEILAILDLTPTGLQVVAHQEVANEVRGGGRLESPVEFRDRGEYTIVRVRAARGNITRGQYVDIDAGTSKDYQEILLPWDSSSRIDIYNYGGGWSRLVE